MTFAIDNLTVFERHGATVTQPRKHRAGCRITLPNRWRISVQWGPCMYGSHYDTPHIGLDESYLTATQAEIVVIKPTGGLVEWADGDTVQGWCSIERVQHILDLLATGELLRNQAHQVADDQWQETNA